MVKIDLKGLTDGERLLIKRRRDDISQEQAALRYGMTRNVYGRVERDQEEWVDNTASPVPEVGELSQDEICLLLRRRSEMTQEECAELIGVTRFWLNQMETGKVLLSELVDFWEARK